MVNPSIKSLYLKQIKYIKLILYISIKKFTLNLLEYYLKDTLNSKISRLIMALGDMDEYC